MPINRKKYFECHMPPLSPGLMLEPLAVTKRDACRIVPSPRIVQRWQFYGWITVVRPGGRGRQTLIDYASLVHAYQRYCAGEQPPLLPSEARER